MMANLYGKIVMVNCRILDYISKRQSWEANEKQLESKRKVFAELLEDGPEQQQIEPKPKRQKRKQDEIDALFENLSDTSGKSNRANSKQNKSTIQTKDNENTTDTNMAFILSTISKAN